MILIFAGTKEGNEIIKELALKSMDIFASFSTSFGPESVDDFLRQEAGKCDNVVINSKETDLAEILSLIDKYNINIIVDATHPFAVNISKNAMQAAAIKNIRYIRFERKECPVVGEKNIYYSDSFEESAKLLESFPGNVLLTIGVNKLKEYHNIINDRNRDIYVKILPTAGSINKALEYGINIKQIVAFYGFWGKDLLKSFIAEKSIGTVVTKQSGFSGGEDEKILAALETKCNLIIIRRPNIEYSNICYDFSSLSEIIESFKI